MGDAYDWLVHDHSDFEAELHAFLGELEREHWPEIRVRFRSLSGAILGHLAMEEEVIYPAYQAMPDLPQRPILALRTEHLKILSLLRELAQEVAVGKALTAERLLEHLEVALISHHEKEEEFFLPIAGFLLLPRREDIEARLAAYDPSTASSEWRL